jgi:hypothetical protein
MATIRSLAFAFLAAWAPILVNGQSFDPNGIQDPNGYNATQIGTNATSNATYNNPIMTTNAGDP